MEIQVTTNSNFSITLLEISWVKHWDKSQYLANFPPPSMYFALLFFVVESNPSLFPSSAKRILPLENLKFYVQNRFFFSQKVEKSRCLFTAHCASWREKNLTGGNAQSSPWDMWISPVIFRPIKLLEWSKVGFRRGPQTFIQCCRERIQQSPLEFSAFFALRTWFVDLIKMCRQPFKITYVKFTYPG